MSILETIKTAAVEAYKAEQPVELRLGKVLSTDPLQIKISDTVTLTKPFIMLNGDVHEGESVSVIRQQGGQRYLVLGDRTEHITGTVIDVVGGEATDTGSSSQRSLLCTYAKSKLGCKYVYGAAGENTFDCSGFTQWCYRQVGITIPRTAAAQCAAATKLSRSQLKMGDLVFFQGTTSKSGVSHVGLYISGSTFIHAPHTGDVVRTASLDSSYYTAHWYCGGRFIKD